MGALLDNGSANERGSKAEGFSENVSCWCKGEDEGDSIRETDFGGREYTSGRKSWPYVKRVKHAYLSRGSGAEMFDSEAGDEAA
jgi:hypothetical protein